MAADLLGELRAIREVLADIRDLQAAMVRALLEDEGEDDPGTDLEGRRLPRDRAGNDVL